MSNPKHYSSEVPRVSSIVSFCFPFEGTENEVFFHKWLEGKGISVKEYMKEAETAGTFIHKKMEDFILTGKKYTWSKYKELIENAYKFVEEMNLKKERTEVYFCNNDFQWTVDLICEYEWEKWIMDWKTWWIAREKFWLENNNKKKTDKLKKAELQLSLYAKHFKIKNIWVIELRGDWVKFHTLKRINNKELNMLISKYKLHSIED